MLRRPVSSARRSPRLVRSLAGPFRLGWLLLRLFLVVGVATPARAQGRAALQPGHAGVAVSASATPESQPDVVQDDDDPDAPTAAEAPLQVAVRTASFAAILTLVGAVVFGMVVAPGVHGAASASLRARLSRGVRRAGGGAAIAVALTGVARVLAQRSMLTESLGGGEPVPLGDVMSAAFGASVALQIVGGLLGAVAFMSTSRSRPSGGATAMLPWLALIVAAAPALGGHAAGEEAVLLPIVADTMHTLAAGAWVGTLLLLALVGIPAALAEGSETCGQAVLAMLRRFSPVALGSAGVLALTGTYAAWIHVASLNGLRSTRYGHALLLKLALLAVMALVGAFNWRRLGPGGATGSGARRLSASARAELAIAAAIIVVTAVLVARPTPADIMP